MVVLSLFSGVGLLDMGFKEAGFCVVRGPDLLWGDDIRTFDGTPLKGKIDGIIGGVPCQRFSSAVKKENKAKHPDLWPDFWRVVREINPKWALAENVYGAERSATDMFSVNGICPTFRKIVFSDLGSAQARPRLIVYAGENHETFWKLLNENGGKWGSEWRERIGRDKIYKYRTVTGAGTIHNDGGRIKNGFYPTVMGDSLIPRVSGKNSKPHFFLKGDMLLDAFDLPKDWKLPEHAKFNRGTTARLITQGVPVAAAYALAMAVKYAEVER